MAETFGGLGIKAVIREGKDALVSSDIVIRRTDGSTMQPGHVVGENGETHPDIDLSADGDLGFLGVILGPVFPGDDYDIDDDFGDNTFVYVLKPTGGRTIVALFYSTLAVNTVVGQKVKIASDDDGDVMAFVYGDGVQATDSMEEVVGTAVKVNTGSTTNRKVALVRY